ncbi:MAG: hypothetical protein NTW76_13795 [Corynebacteriales bacterium]|nr:hypothetical protein [Mycobacteriales bacterium]
MTTTEKTTDTTPDGTEKPSESTPPEPPNVTVTDPPEDPDTQGDNTTDRPVALEGTEPPAEGDTFDRAYVEDLRKESAGYRTQLRTVQEQLHRALVEKSGLLADPADLPFDATHLEDPEALAASIEQLTTEKPHLKARRFVGDVGQGRRGSAPAEVNLLGMLQGRV